MDVDVVLEDIFWTQPGKKIIWEKNRLDHQKNSNGVVTTWLRVRKGDNQGAGWLAAVCCHTPIRVTGLGERCQAWGCVGAWFVLVVVYLKTFVWLDVVAQLNLNIVLAKANEGRRKTHLRWRRNSARKLEREVFQKLNPPKKVGLQSQNGFGKALIPC